MNRLPLFIVAFVLVSLFNACGPKKETHEGEEVTEADSTEAAKPTEPEIFITPVKDSPTFSASKLTMNSPEASSKVGAGNVHFSYTVGGEGYTLADQTEDAEIKQCANSGKGQHIHLILNNQPYSAHYEAEFDKELEAGHYVALSFLSRSYHESVKHGEGFILNQFTVGDVEAEEADLSAPHMFYSRPKGTYKGADTKKILLDFYLVNTEISPEGNKVRATINGKEFILTEWVPYFVEGLPLGENAFKLELIDSEGNLIEGPFNSVERKVTLSES